MKTKYLFYLIIFIYSTQIIAQTPSWSWVKGPSFLGSLIDPYSNGNVTTKEGVNYIPGWMSGSAFFDNILVSVTVPFAQTGSFLLTKYDSSGNVVWVHTGYGGSGFRLALDNSENCYVVGGFQGIIAIDNDTITSSNYISGFISKFDSAGNYYWMKKILAPYMQLDCIITDSIGNSYLAGYFSDTLYVANDTLVEIGGYDIFLIKFDTYGNEIWAKSFNSPNAEKITGISMFDNSTVYITGTFQDSIYFNTTLLTGTSSPNMFVAKIDSSANLIWAKTNGGLNQNFVNPTDLTIDANAQIFICGYFKDSLILGNDTLVSPILNRPQVFTARYDSAGNEKWIRMGCSNELVSTRPNAICSDEFGNILITGTYEDTIVFSGDTLFSPSNPGNFVVKYSSLGNLLWTKQSAPSYGANGIGTDDYGNCYVSGSQGLYTYFDTIHYNSNCEFYLAKLSCAGIRPEISNSNGILHSTSALSFQWFFNGVLIPGAVSQNYTPLQNGDYTVFTKDINVGSSSAVYSFLNTGISENAIEHSIAVFPNPSNGTFNFFSRNEPIKLIVITDACGKEIISSSSPIIDLSYTASGIYLYKLISVEGNVFYGLLYRN